MRFRTVVTFLAARVDARGAFDLKTIRGLSVLIVLLSALALPVTGVAGRRKVSATDEFFVYIGSSKSERTDSKGIYIYRFKAGTGQLTSLGLAKIMNPAFLAVHPSRRFLYTVNQTADYDTSAVTAFAIDRTTGGLTLLNQVPSRGANPVYVLLDKTGRYALVANYIGDSVAAFPLLDDGRLGEASAFVQYSESSVNHPERPKGAYPHSIDLSPDNRFALVTALGLDKLFVYRFDQARGSLAPNDIPFFSVAPGGGPRHIAFDPSGKHVYSMNETAGTVTVFSYNAVDGGLRELQTISTLPKDFKGKNASAEIEVYPSGKFLYASNRGHDSIAVFAVEPKKGTLMPVENVPTQGNAPGNFQFDPTGSYLFVANENSNNVVVFRVDPKVGRLSSTGQVLEVPCPQNMVFVATE
jgi:6-phosphogluconolactonase